MRHKFILLSLIFLLCVGMNNALAQVEEDSWQKILFLSTGVFGLGSEYSGQESSTIEPYNFNISASVRAKYEPNVFYYGGFELSKENYGIQGNFGYIPAKIKADLTLSIFNNRFNGLDVYDISIYYWEGDILLFPKGIKQNKFFPYFSLGAGGFKVNGDLSDAGFLFSFGGGVRIYTHKEFGANIGLKGLIMNYGENEDIPGKSLRFMPFQITFGFLYRL